MKSFLFWNLLEEFRSIWWSRELLELKTNLWAGTWSPSLQTIVTSAKLSDLNKLPMVSLVCKLKSSKATLQCWLILGIYRVQVFEKIGNSDVLSKSCLKAKFITRRSILGSDCIDSYLDALGAHWVLSDCSLFALWVLTDRWLIPDWLLEDLSQNDEDWLL